MKHNESKLQIKCVKWFNYQYPKYKGLLFSVPNGGSRNKIEASRLKKEGVVAGVSDLILNVPSGPYNILCIEMKFGKNKQTQNQIEWEGKVKRAGSKYVVVNSFDKFMNEIESYLINQKLV